VYISVPASTAVYWSCEGVVSFDSGWHPDARFCRHGNAPRLAVPCRMRSLLPSFGFCSRDYPRRVGPPVSGHGGFTAGRSATHPRADAGTEECLLSIHVPAAGHVLRTMPHICASPSRMPNVRFLRRTRRRPILRSDPIACRCRTTGRCSLGQSSRCRSEDRFTRCQALAGGVAWRFKWRLRNASVFAHASHAAVGS
jgi:hypothetical protein